VSTGLAIATIALVSVFALAQFRFVVLCLSPRMVKRQESPPIGSADLPLVAIQIATYREAAALPALLQSIEALHWPKDRILVHVLDDSPQPEADATRAIVMRYAHAGLHVAYLNRSSRAGYKAGALNYGLAAASPADLIAYFDADCRPRPNFLHRMFAQLQPADVAAVQARWEYPNSLASPLTILQAAAFEYLFRYEYETRAQLGLPAYYLGSAAVWRRQAIQRLGGWRQTEPLTAEDVDMGYRAAAAGWRILYEPEALADDDAVEDILVFRAQQRRWAQAVTQAALDASKNLIRMRRSMLATLIEWSSLLPHATIVLTLLIGLLIALNSLLGGQVSTAVAAAEWVFSLLVLAPPSVLALVLAVRAFHCDDWCARTALLARAGPYGAAVMTSFIFGLSDLVMAAKREFVVTAKAGQTPILKGTRQRWLAAQVPPLLFDLVVASILAAGVVAALQSNRWSAILPTTVLAVAFSLSAWKTGWAFRSHWSKLVRSTPAPKQTAE
jgi:cellulose synthase/poly-beta-1,6-N-acetylglucosamine synthase-like glycosyltransferase